MTGKIYRDRGDRWLIRVGKARIYCDKEHRTLYSKQHAEWVLAQIQGELEKGTFDADFYSKHKRSIRSFRSYGEAFIDNCRLRQQRGELSLGYVRRLAGVLYNHWIPFFGEANIAEIRGNDLVRFYLQLGGSPKTRTNIMGSLHSLFRQAWQEEVIPQVPRFPRLERVPKRIVPWATKEQQDAILDLMDDRARYLVQFCIAHGVRIGEARGLQHGDIDTGMGTVRIRRALGGANSDVRPYPKGKSERILPLDPEWKRLYLQGSRGLPSAWVFVGKRGGPCGKNFAYRAWVKACRTVGVKCNFHEGTRHSKASQLGNAGVPVHFIQQLLGHRNLETTMRYTHMNVESLRRVLQGTVVKGNFSKVSANDKEDL